MITTWINVEPIKKKGATAEESGVVLFKMAQLSA